MNMARVPKREGEEEPDMKTCRLMDNNYEQKPLVPHSRTLLEESPLRKEMEEYSNRRDVGQNGKLESSNIYKIIHTYAKNKTY